MSTLRAAVTVVSLAVAAVGLGACGSSSTAPAASSSASASAAPSTSAKVTASGSLDAADQSSDGKSVVVASVNLDAAGETGWIALHTDVAGKPGPVKYWVAVPSGASTNISIPTPGGIPTGTYWPMLHVDDHAVGTYEFPKVAGADLPVVSGGMVVMKKIAVTVK